MRFRKLTSRERRPAPAAERNESQRRRRGRLRASLTYLLLGVLVLCAAYWYWVGLWIVTKGRVVAPTVAIAATVTGRIAEILVKQGDQVDPGQTLVRLDRSELEAALKEAHARLEEFRAKLAVTRATGVDPVYRARIAGAEADRLAAVSERQEVEARLAAAREELDLARDARERAEQLFALNALTRPDLDAETSKHLRLVAQTRTLEAQRETRTQRVRQVEATILAARDQLARAEQAHAGELEQLGLQVQQAEQRVAQIAAKLELMDINSPAAGTVAWVHKAAGDVVDHDDSLLSVVNYDTLWIEAYVDADDLRYAAPGQAVTVKFDGYAGGRLSGHVADYLSRYDDSYRGPRIGPELIRSASRLGSAAHPLRILLDEPWPADVREEMIASVRIKKRS